MKTRDLHSLLRIDGTSVGIVGGFRFLGIQITESLALSLNTNCIFKKAQQRLFVQNRLKSFGVVEPWFYCCTTESILTTYINVWLGNVTAQEFNVVKMIVQTALKIIDTDLPQPKSIYYLCCQKRAESVIMDASYPAHALFTLLSSGKRYGCITTCFRDSYIPQAISLLNNRWPVSIHPLHTHYIAYQYIVDLLLHIALPITYKYAYLLLFHLLNL